MALSEAIVNKVKVLLYEDEMDEAEAVLVSEANMSVAEARDFVARMEGSLTKSKQGSNPKNTKKLGLTFLVLGVLLTVLAAYLLVLKKQALENSILTQGVVIGFSYDESDKIWQDNRFDDDITYAPIITYELNGKEYRNVSKVSSYPPAFDLNEKVEVYINKDDPYNMTVNTFIHKWLWVVILGSLGVIFGLIGILVLIIKPSSSTSGINMFNNDDEWMGASDD